MSFLATAGRIALPILKQVGYSILASAGKKAAEMGGTWITKKMNQWAGKLGLGGEQFDSKWPGKDKFNEEFSRHGANVKDMPRESWDVYEGGVGPSYKNSYSQSVNNMLGNPEDERPIQPQDARMYGG